ILYQDKYGVSLFQYCSLDALRCSFDCWYPDIKSVYKDWNDNIDEHGWIDIDDPLTDCHNIF
ncbi:MAG: hypothetical protein K2O29_03360, partial [Ruminococcus sp.]|nr:hypothetical protein [Ruminococcus sp.]